MLNKKIIFLAIFIVSLLAVSAVSAADNSTENIASTDNDLDSSLSAEVSVADNSQDDIINIDNTENVITDELETDDLNFKNLSDEINSGQTEITLEKNYKYNPNTDSGYETLTIDYGNSISIDGKGHYIDGNNKFECLNIWGDNVLFKNITFKNFYSESSDLFRIYGDGCTFDNCTFENMFGKTSHYTYCSIIYESANDITITNCKFTNNRCYEVINMGSTNSKIFGCNFINNNAANIIRIGYFGEGNDQVTNSYFSKNTVDNYLISVDSENCNVTGCVFEDYAGRPIYIAYDDLNCYVDNGIYDFYIIPSKECTNIGHYDDESCLAEIEYYGIKTGNISVYLNGVESYNCKIADDEFQIDSMIDTKYIRIFPTYLKNVPRGNVNMKILFISDDSELEIYNGTIKLDYYLGVEPYIDYTNQIAYNDYAVFYVELPEGATGDLSISYGNINKNNVKYDKDSYPRYKLKIQTKDLSIGTHTLTVKLTNDPIFADKTINYKFYVVKQKSYLSADTLTHYYGSNLNVILSLYWCPIYNDISYGINGAKLSITLNGKVYTPTTDKNGEVRISVKGLAPNTYTATIKFAGNAHYKPVTKSVKIIIKKAKTKVLSSPVTTTYNGGKYIVATLKDKYGKAISGVKLTIKLSNGKTFTPTTNKNGQVKVSTNKLAPKTYTAKISFAGNSKYVKSTKSVKVTVKKAKPKITVAKKTFKRKVATKKFKITLTNNKKPVPKIKVTLNVNGEKYSVKTKSNGEATFKLTKLTKKGKYKTIIKTNGNKLYNKAKQKVIIKVK